MEYIVDRIEGMYVIAEDEDENIITIEVSNVKGVAKEGDIIKKVEETFYIDEEATKIRKKKINTIMKGMWN